MDLLRVQSNKQKGINAIKVKQKDVFMKIHIPWPTKFQRRSECTNLKLVSDTSRIQSKLILTEIHAYIFNDEYYCVTCIKISKVGKHSGKILYINIDLIPSMCYITNNLLL